MEADMSRNARPCEPDDVYRVVKRLSVNKIISRRHIHTLAFYGKNERPPDPRCREEERAHILWNEAFDKITTVLKKKDIIE